MFLTCTCKLWLTLSQSHVLSISSQVFWICRKIYLLMPPLITCACFVSSWSLWDSCWLRWCLLHHCLHQSSIFSEYNLLNVKKKRQKSAYLHEHSPMHTLLFLQFLDWRINSFLFVNNCCQLLQRLLPTCAYDPHCVHFRRWSLSRQLQTYILTWPLCWTAPPSPLFSSCARFRRRCPKVSVYLLIILHLHGPLRDI